MTVINAVGNALTGSTGSGAFVGATSPTLITPASLGVQQSALNMNTHQINGLVAGVAGTDAVNVTQLTAVSALLTTKGDLFGFSTVNARVAVASGNGKILQVDSTAAVGLSYSTPTYPSASGSSGKFLISDGTNNVYSTSTIPTSAGATANKVLLSDGTNYVLSTPTFPNASETLNKIIKSDGTNWIASTETWAVPGSANNALISDGTNWTALATNPVIQRVSTETGAVATGTTVLVSNDTIPQNTAGDQYMTLAITPKNTNNILVIQAMALCTNSSATPTTMAIALFQDSTANALAALGSVNQATANLMIVTLNHVMTAGTTSSTTFKIRIGGTAVGTTTFNGTGGNRRYGGIAASSIIITEYAT